MDYKMVGKINKTLLSLGFQSHKDVLGTYFIKTTHRFSIMKHGNAFLCYYNMHKDNQWQLVDKSGVFQNYTQAIHWVYERAAKAL